MIKYVKLCMECGEQLAITDHFCSLICAERFTKAHDAELNDQQEEELSYIRAVCLGSN